jgi:MFS family permease
MNILKHLAKTTFSSFTIRNYRLYFIGQAISLSGTWMQTVALSWLVLQLTHSGTALGVVTACQFLPILLLGTWGGVIADRFPKRTILFITQTAGAVVAIAVGLLIFYHMIQIWIVYIIAVCMGLINAVDNPTRQTFVFEMVGKKQLANAVSLSSTLFNAARIAGPAFAGVIISSFGLAPCFIINGISFAGAIVAIAMMRSDELNPSEPLRNMNGHFSQTIQYIVHSHVHKYVLLMLIIIGTFTYEFNVILPLIARFTFHGDARTFASLTASMGVGSVIGGLISTHRKSIGLDKLVSASLFLGVSIVFASFVSSYTAMIVALIFVGIFSINFTTLANVILQTSTVHAMRGRVMSLWTIAILGTTPIGGPIIGWIGEHVGPRWGLGVGGVAAIGASIIGLFMFTLKKTQLASEMVQETPILASEDKRI